MLSIPEGEKGYIATCTSKEYREFTRSTLRPATVYKNTMPTLSTSEGKWVIRRGQPWPGQELKEGTFPYAVLPDAEVRIAKLPRPLGQIDHSELVNGQDVIAAGMLKFHEGKIAYISNESGHYCPDSDCPSIAKMVFNFWGLPMIEDVVLDGSFSCF
jgi:hypothetical protein